MSTKLIRYDAACRALAAATTVDEPKKIRDQAEAMRAYARQANNKELELQAWEIRTRAERRLGELIKAQKEAGKLATGTRGQLAGRKPGKRGKGKKGLSGGAKTAPPDKGITLSDALRVDKNTAKKLSARSQKLAAMPQSKFEKMVGEARSKVEQENERITGRLPKEADIVASRQSYNDRTAQGGTVADLKELGQKFAVIYADPPWEFKVYSGKGKQRSAERHYDVKSIKDICAMPVPALAAKDCALLLWCVMPELPGPRRVAKNVHQIVMSPVSRHSAKPAEARKRIERLLVGPYLELFARGPAEGWTVWGNEVGDDVDCHGFEAPQTEAAE